MKVSFTPHSAHGNLQLFNSQLSKKVCLGNLLIFISQYMLIPILPVVMAGGLELSIAATGAMFLVMVLGMIVVGPFYGYLMDTCKRKSLCIVAFAIVFTATIGYTFVDRPLELLSLCLVQGFAFGVANSSIITLGIDVNISENRSKGNIIFGWVTRLGMILGVGSGSAVFLNYGFETLVAASVITGCAGVLFIAAMHIPFRAPIGMALCSTDRFFLPHTFPFVLNMVFIAFAAGVLFPLIHFKMRDTFLLDEWTVPYYAIAAGAFLLPVFLVNLLKKLSLWLQALLGMTAMACAICSLIVFDSIAGQLLSAILLGVGLSIITPAFLLFFINLSSHCQRSTANTTHLLSWKIGASMGLATSCYLTANQSPGAAFHAALMASVVAVAFFVGVSYPYYRKKKVR